MSPDFEFCCKTKDVPCGLQSGKERIKGKLERKEFTHAAATSAVSVLSQRAARADCPREEILRVRRAIAEQTGDRMLVQRVNNTANYVPHSEAHSDRPSSPIGFSNRKKS